MLALLYGEFDTQCSESTFLHFYLRYIQNALILVTLLRLWVFNS